MALAQPQSAFKITLCYVKGRKYMYDRGLCHIDMAKLKALTKITNHLEYAKNYTNEQQLIQIRFLMPELEAIIPGKQSKKYSDAVKKLETIKNLINGRG